MNIDFSTFDSFVQSTINQHIGQGECWDYINLLWTYLGGRYYTYPPSDPSSTNHGVKWGWINAEARSANTINHISQIASLNDVKRGDCIIISDGEYGHAGFASADYDGSGYISMYSQNYNWVEYVKLDTISMSGFLGAFRYDEWNVPPTQPTPTSESKFPWFIYNRRLNNRRNGLMI